MPAGERTSPPSGARPSPPASALRRVGHKGADLIAPGNTLASFDAALDAGVDMIEFDVLPERGTGRLILAHDYEAAARGTPPSFEEGLAHFASEAFRDVELDVDLKLAGYEQEVVEGLRAHGLLPRSMVSSQYMESLALVRRLEPSLRLGWSVPRVRRDYLRSPLTRPGALALLALYRRVLPRHASTALRDGRCDALMAQWRLVTPRLVAAVKRAGGELFAWTVDDPERIRALEAWGVDGVITNDPRLFAPPA